MNARIPPLDSDIHLPTNAIVGALITAAIGALAWIIKVAARQALAGFQQSLETHTEAIRNLTATVEEHRREMAEIRVVEAGFNERLKAVESR